MAKTKKPTVVRNGSWYTITSADGEETKVQGEEARDEALRDLGHDPEKIETTEAESTASSSESDESTSAESTEERYDDPPEPGTEDDRPREAEEDTTPATDPDAADDEGETAENFEAGNVSSEAHDAIPAGVRAKQPGAKSTEEQEVEEGVRDEDEAFVPEEVRLAQEDDERRKELADLTPEEAHLRQGRRANEAGAARTRRPVVPGPRSDTSLPQTGEQKQVPEDLDEEKASPRTGAEDDPETAIDARGYQTANDGRGPFSAESLATEDSEAAERQREERKRRERLEGLTPEERQEFLIEEAEEREESKPEVARKPALAAALDTTVESNVTLRSGVPTGPAHHPETVRTAPDGTEPGNTLRGYVAPQKTPELLGVGASTDESADEEE